MRLKTEQVKKDLKSLGYVVGSLIFIGLLLGYFAETSGAIDYIPEVVERIISGVAILFYAWIIFSWLKDRYWE